MISGIPERSLVGTLQKWFRIIISIQKNDVLCKLLPPVIRL